VNHPYWIRQAGILLHIEMMSFCANEALVIFVGFAKNAANSRANIEAYPHFSQ
jgi:hypothetical protein